MVGGISLTANQWKTNPRCRGRALPNSGDWGRSGAIQGNRVEMLADKHRPMFLACIYGVQRGEKILNMVWSYFEWQKDFSKWLCCNSNNEGKEKWVLPIVSFSEALVGPLNQNGHSAQIDQPANTKQTQGECVGDAKHVPLEIIVMCPK